MQRKERERGCRFSIRYMSSTTYSSCAGSGTKKKLRKRKIRDLIGKIGYVITLPFAFFYHIFSFCNETELLSIVGFFSIFLILGKDFLDILMDGDIFTIIFATVVYGFVATVLGAVAYLAGMILTKIGYAVAYIFYAFHVYFINVDDSVQDNAQDNAQDKTSSYQSKSCSYSNSYSSSGSGFHYDSEDDPCKEEFAEEEYKRRNEEYEKAEREFYEWQEEVDRKREEEEYARRSQEESVRRKTEQIEDALRIFGYKMSDTYTMRDLKIKRKELQKKYHPDVNQSSADYAKMINTAFDILSQTAK